MEYQGEGYTIWCGLCQMGSSLQVHGDLTTDDHGTYQPKDLKFKEYEMEQACEGMAVMFEKLKKDASKIIEALKGIA